ncbi:MAG: hypothetical protein IJK99_01530 [Bacteroidales bacterium]|nr:hypothetical protein [Bacteroidales bacterium]
MNNNQDIDKLFEAARRREADQRRQQQLSDMIDRLAEDERKAESGKRKAKGGLFWTYAGIAASVLLLASVGLHILSQDSNSPSQQPMIAGTKTQPTTAVDSTASIPATQTDVVVPVLKPHTSPILAQSETPAEVQSPESRQNEIEEKETAIETPTVLPDEPLLAEETENGNMGTENEAGSNISHPTSPIVYERTSSRLVCGSGCRPEVRPSQEDSPRFAFTNISSTGTTIGVGTSAF